MSEQLLFDALDELVPSFDSERGHWESVLEDAAVEHRPSEEVAPRSRRRLLSRRRGLVGAVLLALVTALLATPAFGLRDLLLSLIGRSTVPFTGKTAPLGVKRDFADLALGLPPSMGPRAIAAETRTVTTFHVDGRMVRLWVAPTRTGGFCETFEHHFGGCRTRTPAPNYPQAPGAVNDYAVGMMGEVTNPAGKKLGGGFSGGLPTGPGRSVELVPSLIGGDLLTPTAQTVELDYADGDKSDIPFVYVTAPINAGFFLYRIPRGHQTLKGRLTAILVLDDHGHVLAKHLIYRQRVQLPHHIVHQLNPPHPIPPPSPPVQRGQADGVSLVVGRNGVAKFNTTQASGRVRALLGSSAGYACFRFTRYHEDAPAEPGFPRTNLGIVSIQIFGLAPFDGCEIQGTYGHTWPDRNHSHSAVEIPLTPRGRRYFQDKAAASDLALFVRSATIQKIRKITGTPLTAALQKRYGNAINRLASTASHLKPDTIGYTISVSTTTFVEYSTTGRRFYAKIKNGRVTNTNLRILTTVY
jgi:hypothetical protein